MIKRYFDKPLKSSYITVIDIETTGVNTKDGSPILTYSLVTFKPENVVDGNLVDNLQNLCYKGINPQSFRELGIKGDISTHNWYENYVNVNVYDQNLKMAKEGLDLYQALLDVANTINTINQLASSEETNHYIFGNSPDFDQAMFDVYFDKFDIAKPWRYWQNLDLRTLTVLFHKSKEEHIELEKRALSQYKEAMIKYNYSSDLILDIAKHTAVYDAIFESLHLLDILKKAEV